MTKIHKAIIIVASIIAFHVLWFAFCGFQWCFGPFSSLHNVKVAKFPGNAAEYDLERVDVLDDSPIKGKTILFLGSSITQGTGSQNVSFADYICHRNGAEMIKEAVSGTTLVDNGAISYIARLKRLDKKMKVDLLVCQLSTNDAWTDAPLGAVSKSAKLQDFDTKSVTGAIEYIMAYAKETWDCPVVFYTSPKFKSERYDQMVTLLHKAAEKWECSVIDMWNDKDFNNITEQERVLYLKDDTHPAKAGYLKWWVPFMEPTIYKALEK